MKLGDDLFGSEPLVSLEDSEDFSAEAPFKDLLRRPELPRIFLAEMQPFDRSSSTTVTRRFSLGTVEPLFNSSLASTTLGYGTSTLAYGSSTLAYSGSVAGVELWPARLERTPDFETDILGSNLLGGTGTLSFGPIDILIGDRDNDDMRDFEWSGRVVDIKMGGLGFSFDEFNTIVKGRVDSVSWDKTRFRIQLTDARSLLNEPLQQNMYEGTGGDEGGDDIKGQPKPRTLGAPENISPVLLERVLGIYQFNDRQSKAVVGVFDRGVPLTAANNGGNDITTLALDDVRDWTPIDGEYITDLAKGLIRVGAEPAGTLTADVQGDVDGLGALISTVSDIVQYIIAGASDAPLTIDEIERGSFSSLNFVNDSSVSRYIANERPTVNQLINEFINSIGGYLVPTVTGRLKIGVIRIPFSSLVIREKDIISLRRVEPPRPSWRRKLGYRRSYTVQSQEDINTSAATDERKDFVKEELRFAIAEDESLKTTFLRAEEGELNTLIDNDADAQAEADRQLLLLGTRRDVYELRIMRWQWQLEAGQTATIVHSDLRKNDGRKFLIVGVSERGRSGETLATVWG